MKNYFIFDGVSSQDFRTKIAISNMFDGAERDIESVSVPGRSGDLLFSNERFKNFTGEAQCYMYGNVQTLLPALRAFLLSREGYCRYEEAFRADEYRMASFQGGFQVSSSDRRGAAFALSFNCMPQRWLKSGEEVIVTGSLVMKNGAYILRNPTAFISKPLIRLHVSSTAHGTITVGNKTLTVSGISSYVDIDSEIMDAYTGSSNMNKNVNGIFPELLPGDNNIKLSGAVTRADITPRWFTI